MNKMQEVVIAIRWVMNEIAKINIHLGEEGIKKIELKFNDLINKIDPSIAKNIKIMVKEEECKNRYYTAVKPLNAEGTKVVKALVSLSLDEMQKYDIEKDSATLK